MLQLSHLVLRFRWPVVIGWIVLAVAGAAAAGPLGDRLSQRFDLPGAASTAVNDDIVARYGNGGFGTPYLAVVTLPAGTTVDSPGVQGELAAALGAVERAAPDVRAIGYSTTGDRAFVSADGRTTWNLIYPRYTGPGTSPDEAAVVSALAGVRVAGAQVELTGLASAETGEPSEGGTTGALVETMVGGLGALVVLLWVFGSFLALLPLLVAAVSILTCFLCIWAMTGVTDVSFIIQFLIALIGLGVAIDYSLLLVTRWREERAAGHDATTATHRAMATAGHAVVFSGTTVAVALLALVLIPIPVMRSIGLGGLLIPLVSVAVSVTLLPVILATVGPRLDWPRLRRGPQTSRFWERWAGTVVRQRWAALVAGLVILALLIVPALSLRLASPVSNAFTGGDSASAAIEAAGFPDGVFTPYEIIVPAADAAPAAGWLREVDGVTAVIAPEGADWQRDGQRLLLAIPAVDGSTGAGAAIIQRIRDRAADEPGPVRIGGATVGDADFMDAVYGNAGWILAAVLAVTFVLLVRAFRSVLLPLKAVVLNTLSVAAAYGVLVMIWQFGWGSELLFGAAATGAIPSWLPLMVFAFLFGLSMDYEVFILSRMREEYDRTGSTRRAIADGMSHTSRLVTAAAIILFLAFVSMAAVPEVDVQIIATGLAAGILIDAIVIRALLVPALVAVMGGANWWLPGWLRRFAPPASTVPNGPASPVGSTLEPGMDGLSRGAAD